MGCALKSVICTYLWCQFFVIVAMPGLPTAEVLWHTTGGDEVRERGSVMVHLGSLFVNGVRRCSLRRHLAAPPEDVGIDEHGLRGLRLRLTSGDWGELRFSASFQEQVGTCFRDCSVLWERRAHNNADSSRSLHRMDSSDDVIDLTFAALPPAPVLNLMGSPARPPERSLGDQRSRSPRLGREPQTPRRRLLRRFSSAEPQASTTTTPQRTLTASNSVPTTPQRRILRRAPSTRICGSEVMQMSPNAVQGRTTPLQRALRVVASMEEHPRMPSSSEPLLDSEPSPRPVKGDLLEPKTPSKLKAKDDAGLHLCIVCQDAIRQIVFLPCKHLVCCDECGRESLRDQGLRTCPVCRADIISRMSVYL